MNVLYDQVSHLAVDGLEQILNARAQVSGPLKDEISRYRPTRMEMEDPQALERIVVLVNLLDGPVILKSGNRGYGLFAHIPLEHAPGDVQDGDFITKYDGVPSETEEGDYVMENPTNGMLIDGFYGFELRNKGRWINDDRVNFNARVKANWDIRVRRGRDTRTIQPGEEILIDYGEYYDRTGWVSCSVCANAEVRYICEGCNEKYCSMECAQNFKNK